MTLNWTAVTTAPIGVYNIYRSSSANFTPSLTYPTDNHIAQGNVLSYTDSNLSVGTYYYKVAAQDVNGTIYPASTEVTINIAAPAPAVTPTGICQVRNIYGSVVSFFGPDLGTKYAKIAKPGVNTIAGLQSACSQADYTQLAQAYCAQNNVKFQEEVVVYDSSGNWQQTGGGPFGSDYRYCP